MKKTAANGRFRLRRFCAGRLFDAGDGDGVDVLVVIVVAEAFENVQHRGALLGKFASESLKSENLHMYRVYTHHVGEAVPKSGPVFPIVVGEVKGLPDNFVNFVVGLDVLEIENVRVFVCVHGVLLIAALRRMFDSDRM